MDNFNLNATFAPEIDPAIMADMFGEDGLSPAGQPGLYEQGYGQEYPDPPAQGESRYPPPPQAGDSQYAQLAYDPALYDQQYENTFATGNEQYTQGVYPAFSDAPSEFYGQQFGLSAEQTGPYQQQGFQPYGTPGFNGDVQTPMKAPKKAPKKRASKKAPKGEEDDFKITKKSKKASKKRVREPTPSDDDDDVVPTSTRTSRKASKKSFREPTPFSEDEIVPVSYRAFKNASPKNAVKKEEVIDEKPIQTRPTTSRKEPAKAPAPAVEDYTDYTRITKLLPSATAASATPDDAYIEFLDAHLPFVILRLATVCVGLCREENDLDKYAAAEMLAQFAVDFFGKEMWDTATHHYITISQDGDEFELMKACMADCIGTFNGFYSKEVAASLQEQVIECGLWYQQPAAK